MTNLGQYIESLLEKAGLSQTSLAAQCGIHRAYVTRVLKGEKRVPLANAEDWADALRLSGASREEFLDLIALSHSPERVQRLVERLQKR